MKKFREAMASYQSEQEQANVVFAQQKQRKLENLRSDFERRKIENTTRQAIQMEISEKLTSMTTERLYACLQKNFPNSQNLFLSDITLLFVGIS